MRLDIIVLLLIEAFMQMTVGQPLQDVNKLYDDLFVNYRKGVTPRTNQKSRTNGIMGKEVTS
jgi:hypothetical protein